MITLASLFVYPVKSCRGIALLQARLTPRGLQYDREWMVVSRDGRFLSQREAPRLALVRTALYDDHLELSAPDLPTLAVPLPRPPRAASVEVTVWRDHVLAVDEGRAAADWLGEHLHRDVRLVRFDDARPRPTDPAWSQGLAGTSAFADGYPVLVLSRASLDDLNARLPSPLPVDRFRPNVLLTGCAPYAEDAIRGLECGQMRLRIVKPCTRCVITTTDQATAVPQGNEPLRTLRTYRWDGALRGVKFGQNAIVERSGLLEVGARLTSE
ncbi:MAG: MOSC N-terminal beta barrel domain-containing protein [Steroidobacteraceae bacterium]|nr:MOSC N-terminal beta barrel domain-containing protein [Pseudomonadota bacterium]MBP6105333.1 MOSC N-terminal beta barrel domain-containing protein [Steroidobacteraceae bacterium]MBP7012882.1 MOSC N-terminal beta barrel domain-containing protein [Steroidobacteraceae bacterium]